MKILVQFTFQPFLFIFLFFMINFHFVQDRVTDKSLEVCFSPSKDQLVDALTKPIVSTRTFSILSFQAK